jgi:hypothetical protein
VREPAVHSGYGKSFRCAEHRRRARGARAREVLTETKAERNENSFGEPAEKEGIASL